MISVVMATYNGERFIKAQLDSMLCQLSVDDEIIISDDHSTDHTAELINAYQDSRIRFILNENSKRGFSGNFENALKHAKGSIIFMSDQDDVWTPQKVKSMLEALKTCDFTVSDAIVTNINLELVHPSFFDYAHVSQGLFKNYYKTRYIGACMAFKRSVLQKALPIPKRYDLCPHDYWITLVAEAFFNVKLLPEPLIYYRRHDKNASTGGVSKSSYSFVNQVHRRLYCGIQLLLRGFTK